MPLVPDVLDEITALAQRKLEAVGLKVECGGSGAAERRAADQAGGAEGQKRVYGGDYK